MWLQQVGYALITLFLVTSILIFIGILIFNILKKFSGRLFKDENLKYLNIVFVGTVLIALSQLFGPLVATTYPIICGPDSSDYDLLFNSVYINISYNSTSGNYSAAATTDSSDQFYGYKEETLIPLGERFWINNGIIAVNSNPLMKYEDQIFLEIIFEPDGVITSFSRPVIRVGQSSDLTIRFVNRPDPGLYPIRIRGIGGDGRIREAMMVVGISVPVTAMTGNGMQGYSSTYNNISGGLYSGGTSIGGGTTYTTPTRPINITNLSYTSAATYTPIYYTSAATYTPIYSSGAQTYKPSYSAGVQTFAPIYAHESGQSTPILL